MKSKILLISATIMFVFTSYSQAQQTMLKSPGSDTNKNNCKESAGYVYSIIKHDCVKLFEEKIQLKEINPKKLYTSNAVVILSEDQKKAELFLPSLKESLILNNIPNKSKNTIIYKKGKYVLVKSKGYTLKQSNKLVFKS